MYKASRVLVVALCFSHELVVELSACLGDFLLCVAVDIFKSFQTPCRYCLINGYAWYSISLNAFCYSHLVGLHYFNEMNKSHLLLSLSRGYDSSNESRKSHFLLVIKWGYSFGDYCFFRSNLYILVLLIGDTKTIFISFVRILFFSFLIMPRHSSCDSNFSPKSVFV